MMKTLTTSEKDLCESIERLFSMLSETFKSQHNETILLLKY